MNNKLLLIPIVSLGAIVQSAEGVRAETFSVAAVPNPEERLEVSDMNNSGTIDRLASVSTPEMTTTPQAEVPQLAAQVAVPLAEAVAETPIARSLATSPGTGIAPVAEVATSGVNGVSIVAQARPSSGTTTTVPVKIEVGSRGIPLITDLPARIALPSVGLLPGNFEYPVNLGQVVDSSVATSSPITDRLADPALSEHLQDVQTFLTTKPEAFTVPCASLPTADCSPMMKPVNPDAYKAKGLSLKGQDPAANPDSPSAIGPIVRERLRMTVDEVQAYRTAYSQNLAAWSDRVSQCMAEKPRMFVLRSDGAQLPVFFNGQEGTVVRNAAGQAVCTN
jgi:hypothetical protein